MSEGFIQGDEDGKLSLVYQRNKKDGEKENGVKKGKKIKEIIFM